MDARLIAVFEQLSQDMAKVAEAVTHSQYVLDKLLREMKKNGKTVERRLDTIQATQRFLAGQQPRRDGTFPVRPLENDDHD